MTPLTWDGRIRLNESQEMPPNASGVMNSVASTSPKRSTTVSQKIADNSQCRAARSGYGERVTVPALGGAPRTAASGPVVVSDMPRREDRPELSQTTAG